MIAQRVLYWLLLMLLLSGSALADSLTPDKSVIEVGEVTYVRLKGAPAIAVVDWNSSRELTILNSDRKGATVKGGAPGEARLTVRVNGSKTVTTLTVRAQGAVAPVSPATQTGSMPAMPQPAVTPNPPAWTSEAPRALVPLPPPSQVSNLALNKSASQSSTSAYSHANDAQGAADGVKDGNYGFHTENEANPWWQVDLGSPATLSEVRVYNRMTCCQERARTLQVMLSDNGRDWVTAYRHDGSVFGGATDGKPLVVPLNGRQARYLRLQLNESNWLHLDEVEVMGVLAGAAKPPPDGTAAPTGGEPIATVLKPEPTSTGAAARMDLDKPVYAPGEAMTLRWNAPVYPNSAWIGIIPSSIPHGSESVNDQHDVTYQYLGGKTSGTFAFSAPAAGNWDLRMNDRDDGGKEVASVSFKVVPAGSTVLPEPALPAGARMVLEDDLGPYPWVDKSTLQTEQVHAGRAAFLSTGNNHFVQKLGIAGYGTDQFRYLDFWIFLKNPTADIQLQVQVDGTWGKRWGYDAEPNYNGYDWPMEGATGGLPSGRWQHLRVDLLNQLHINAGQAITGLAFSSDNGDAYYDSVYLVPNDAPVAVPQVATDGKMVLEDDLGTYNWVERSALQTDVVAHGRAAFRSTGNNHFLADLGVAGNAPGQFRALRFQAFFIGPEADLQLQVQVNGSWGKRWGFDAGPSYNGYDWPMEGTTGNMPSGRWVEISVDLLNQLHLQPGERITGLAFSSDNGDVYYDSVYLLPATGSAVSNAPTGIGVTANTAENGAVDLTGGWAIVANGYTGRIEFEQIGGQVNGRVMFDVLGLWETLQDLSFDGRTLSFLRPGPNQRYTGALSGNEVRGTFDQGGSGSYAWTLRR